jgi:hypothetical protein
MWSTSSLDKINKPVKKLSKAEEKELVRKNEIRKMVRSAPCVVKFILPEGAKESDYHFVSGNHYLFMGEITNMPGHCIVVDKIGKTRWGYHTDNFHLLTDEEM